MYLMYLSTGEEGKVVGSLDQITMKIDEYPSAVDDCLGYYVPIRSTSIIYIHITVRPYHVSFSKLLLISIL